MRVRITIVGESNAANEADLAQLRGLLTNQLTRFEMSSAGFGVGIRGLEIQDVYGVWDDVPGTGPQQSAPATVGQESVTVDAKGGGYFDVRVGGEVVKTIRGMAAAREYAEGLS